MFFLKELPTQKILEGYAKRFPNMDAGKTAKVLKQLRSASILLRRLEAYFADHDLSQTRFLIMIVLDRNPPQKVLAMKDLVECLDVSKPIISNTLKALQKDGYIEITACEYDGRSKRITLTKSGERKLIDVLPGYYEIINNSCFEWK